LVTKSERFSTALRFSERPSRLLKKRGVSSAQSVPVEPGHPKFASYRLQMLMEQVGIAERGTIAGPKDQMLSRCSFLAQVQGVL
jgi:hypothetical protein